MKRSIYAAAALAVLAGCAKTETEQVPADGLTNIELTLSVKSELGTKAVFDGDSHIKFEMGDYFYGAIAKPEKPATAVMVASKHEDYANSSAAKFSIVDHEAEAPEFKGGFYSITPKDTVDTYKFYGLFPGASVSISQNLKRWRMNLSENQTSTREAWDSKADAMVIKPAEVSSAKKEVTRYNEYDIADTSSVVFAHLFGFGKLTFADIPTEYASYPVSKVVIEAVGEKKDISGEFYVDITSDVDGSPLTAASAKSYINVTPSASTTVADNVAWFVANPGTYDVKITVETPKADLIFERQGLTISRSRITSPTVHFKEADSAVSHDVVLNGETWAQTAFTYSNYIGASRRSVEWGPDGKKMVFSLSYPGSTNDNYGTSYYAQQSAYSSYVQGFAYNDITGGEVHLASDASFRGVNMVKTCLGIYTSKASCDFDICLVNKADTTVLKTIKVETDSSDVVAKGTDYYIENTTGVKDGVFVIRARHLSSVKIRPYLAALILNPAPELVVGAEKISLEKDAYSGSFSCNVYASKAVPEVSSDADWLKVSYADGKVSYSAEANSGDRRKATITIKVTDGNFAVTKTVPVSQKSANAVEYKLSITAADMYPLLQAEAAKYEGQGITSYDYFPIEFTFKAVATDGSGRTMDVTMQGSRFVLTGVSTEYFIAQNSTFRCSEAVGAISKVVIVANNPVNTNNYANLAVKFSKDGETYANCHKENITIVGDYDPYTSTVTNDDDENVFFDINTTGGYSRVYFRSIEVTFIGA